MRTLLVFGCISFALDAAVLPAPNADLPQTKSVASVVLAGGCFWGIEGVYDHVKGVQQAISGYAGGSASTAHYEVVSTGRTGHAESVKVIYDPAQVSFGKLLQIFFSVAHDPTQLNRQGPDEGTQYRSVIFYSTDEERRVAEAYIQQLTGAKAFKHKIVTQLTALQGFFPAEDYHQRYLEHHPDQPYTFINDLPKVRNLKKQFPELYTGK
jgi:peptide-methionine (S)-S-oxide reductase